MIGIFDSGSGGLTVLRAIREDFPSADIIYFGDIKNAPYGSKSNAELSTLTVDAIDRLTKHGATSIVSACNSVSASLAVSLVDMLDLPPGHLIEMVGPTVGTFRGSAARVVLAATPATVRAEIYQNGFRMIRKDITAVAIPDLASAIEFRASEDEMERIIRQAFAGVPLRPGDTLILACTHYPLVAHVFARVFPEVMLFDPAHAVAARVKRELWPREVGEGTLRFMITKDSEPFRERVKTFFPESADAVVVVE